MVRFKFAAPVVLAAGVLFATQSLAAVVTTVASGLDCPKQVAYGPDGNLYVALSGNASGSDPLINGVPANYSGGIARISPTGASTLVIGGLLSRIYEGDPTGPAAVAWWNGHGYIGQGLHDATSANPDVLLSSPMLKITTDFVTISNIRAFTSFEAVNDDPSSATVELDTDPFAAIVGTDGLLYVSDGGENGVWQVQANGDNFLWAQFPGNKVVTGIAAVPHVGPAVRGGLKAAANTLVVCLFGGGRSGFTDGYVATTTGLTNHTLVAPGVITMPIAAAYSPSGQLYILQFATPSTVPGPPFAPGTGAVWAVSSTGAATKVVSGLNYPTGLCFSPDGTAWVSNNGTSTAASTPSGSLVKITGLGSTTTGAK